MSEISAPGSKASLGKNDLRPLIIFCAIGVINTAISYVVYLALREIMPYAVAYVIGWCVGLVGSFFLNCKLTFKVAPSWRGFMLFPLSSIPNLLISTGGVLLFVEVFGWDERIAPLVATLIAIPISYVLARTILAGPIEHAEEATLAAMEH